MAKAKLSGQSLHEFVQSQIERLASRFTHLKWEEPATAKEYKRVLRGLVEVYGQPRVEKAVTSTIDQEQYLDPPALRRHVPNLDGEPDRCEFCREREGWLYILVEGEDFQRVIRCPHTALSGTIQVQIPDKFRPWEKQTVSATVLDKPFFPEPTKRLPRPGPSPFVDEPPRVPPAEEILRQVRAVAERRRMR